MWNTFPQEYQDKKVNYRKQSEVEKNVCKLVKPIYRTFEVLLSIIKRVEHKTFDTVLVKNFSLWSNKKLNDIVDKKYVDNMIDIINGHKIMSSLKVSNSK